MAASRKEDKYVDLGARYIFEPIAVETLGVFNASACHLLINTGEARETSYLFQRISVLVQRFNAVLLHDSLPAGLTIVPTFVLLSQFLGFLGNGVPRVKK